jgi:hypothetical protein
MGDGKTFEQALRALDKLIAEHSRADDVRPSPIPRPTPTTASARALLPSNAEPVSRAATLPAFGVWLSLV